MAHAFVIAVCSRGQRVGGDGTDKEAGSSCLMAHALWPMPHGPCLMAHALGPMPCSHCRCLMAEALCPMPYGRCLMADESEGAEQTRPHLARPARNESLTCQMCSACHQARWRGRYSTNTAAVRSPGSVSHMIAVHSAMQATYTLCTDSLHLSACLI